MLNKISSKLFFLKTILYVIIFFIIGLTIRQGIGFYKSCMSLSANDLENWFNYNLNSNYFVQIKDFKIYLEKLSIVISAQGITIDAKSSNHFNDDLIDNKIRRIHLDQVAGSFNILKLLFAGNITINNLIAKRILITNNEIYPNINLPTLVGKFKIRSNYSFKNNLNVSGDLHAENLHFEINTDLKFNQHLQIINFKLRTYNIDPKKIISLLPDHWIDLKLISWLNQAILSGEVIYGEYIWDLEDDFYLYLKLKDLSINYAPNWPLIEHIDVNVKIINDNLEIYMVDSGNLPSIFKQPIKILTVSMLGLQSSNDSILSVHGKLHFPIKQGLAFLKKVNCYFHLAKFLENLNFNGNAALSINFHIPLDLPAEHINIYGDCEISTANLKIFNITLEDLVGKIQFGNDFIRSEQIQAKLFNQSMRIKFEFNKDLFYFYSPIISFKIPLNHDFSNFNMENFANLSVVDVELFNQKFRDLQLNNTPQKTMIKIQGSDLAGEIGYIKSKNPRYYMDLELLRINFNSISLTNVDYLQWISILASIDFYCKNLYLQDLHLKNIAWENLSIKEDKSNVTKIKITDLNFNTKNMHSKFNVDLTKFNNNHQQQLHLIGDLAPTDFGNLLKEFKILQHGLINGKGKIYVNVYYNDNKLNFSDLNLLSLSGTISLEITKGIITGISTGGIGKIVGLLNLENIFRRLALDFSDLKNSGFNFDLLKGDLIFDQGMVKFNNMFINGPSANIKLTGRIDLGSNLVDANISVISKTGTTLPLAAAVVAGNPAIGAAMWLFDYASGAKFSKFKISNYKVSGSLNNLKIENI